MMGLHRRPSLGRDVGAAASTLGGPLGVVAGWTLLALGVVLLPLPGPGSIVVVAGLRVLVPHHAWAARIYDGARLRMVQATAAGVATWPRVVLSALGPVWLTALTLAYVVDLQISSFSVLGLAVGPGLPLRSGATTTGLAVSTVAAGALLLVAFLRWGPGRPPVVPDVVVPPPSRRVNSADSAREGTRATTRQLVRCR